MEAVDVKPLVPEYSSDAENVHRKNGHVCAPHSDVHQSVHTKLVNEETQQT